MNDSIENKPNLKIAWDVELMLQDMALQGLETAKVARKAGISPNTITRFLLGQFQTVKSARLIAKALGYSTPARYVIRRRKKVS